MRSNTLGSPDAKKKESRGRSCSRREIDLLTKDLDSSEVAQNASELNGKYFQVCRDEEWRSLLKSKRNCDSDKRIPPGKVKNSSSMPSNGVGQTTETVKGRQNLLEKDDVEVAASLMKPSDLYLSGKPGTLPSFRPIVLVDKLDNGSSDSIAHRECALNGHTATTSKPLEKRKFFLTTPPKPTGCSNGLPHAVNGVCNGKRTTNSFHVKFGGKRDALKRRVGKGGGCHALSDDPLPTLTLFERRKILSDLRNSSLEIERRKSNTLVGKRITSEGSVVTDSLSNNGIRDLMPLTDCKTELYQQRAKPATPMKVNGIREEGSIQEESRSVGKTERGSCAKRKTSPMKDSHIVKVRRIDENSEGDERGARSCARVLFEEQSEECEEVVGENELKKSQNGPNQSNSAREAAKVAVESEQESNGDVIRKWATSKLEARSRCRLSGYVTDSSSESTRNCSSVESTTASNTPRSTDTTNSDSCQRTSYAMSPSLQPVVVLRKLICDEVRHHTSERLTRSEEVSQNCAEQCESINNSEIADEEPLISFVKKVPRKFYDVPRKGYRKSYGRKRKSLECDTVSPEDHGNGPPREQETPGYDRVSGAVCQMLATKSPYSCVVRNSMTNGSRSEGASHHNCNSERDYTRDKIIGRNDDEDIVSKYGSDKASSNGGPRSGEDVNPDISTARRDLPYPVLLSDNRKCCGNDMCRVATPELIGLENPLTSNRCWMNVTLQTLFSMENFMQSMIKAFEDVNAEANSLISCILTLHYARSLGHQECVYEQGRKLAEVLGTLKSEYVLNDQQDPSEFMLWLFNHTFEPALEKYGPSWASGLVAENFRFEMEERTCCTGCLNHDVKIGYFLILMLDIYVGTSKIRTIQEALAAYTSTKTLMRPCGQCGEEKSLVKTAFKSVPRYLIINLKRYSLKDGEVIRDETPVRHSNTLSVAKCSVPNNVTNCSKDEGSVAVASPPKYNIGRKSLRRVEGEYDLISIIHHSGFSVSSGHYVCDVYHRRTNKWYSYNDKMVKEVCQATLFSAKRQKTGYIYVYQNKNY